MIQKTVSLLFVAFLLSCNNNDPKEESQPSTNEKAAEKEAAAVKNHSYSNIDEIHTEHLHLDLNINFDEKIISGVARHEMKNNDADKAIFDMQAMSIDSITTGRKDNEKTVEYSIGESDELLGAPLTVDITPSTQQVNIYYQTSPEAQALDWLDPSLTGSGKHPFLYTQGQAILTRSWVPVQDTPGNRFTYTADLQVPSELLALMSASNPTSKNESGSYSYEMSQPIPSYLLALAVGELEYAQLGEQSGVYAEPHMIDAVASEFRDIPKMMDAAQELYGEYLWETYDVIVLPHSFPFGGMENPRLTFATPTLIAGDRSLVSVIAHELAHSWSGNLVTNASWNDFWLNEGFTVYFENRIMEEIYGEEVADMLALIEYQELEESVDQMMAAGNGEDTHLKLHLDHRNPDEGMTDIAYVKGAFFLKTLEKAVGRDKFDAFLRKYFEKHKFETLTTEDFVKYLKANLLEKENVDFNVDEWIYEDGIPDNVVTIDSDRFEEAQNMARQLKETGALPANLEREDKTTQEWLAFIRALEGELSTSKMKEVDEQLNFRESGNAEIMSEWFILGIKNDYTELRPDIEAFLKKVGRRKFLRPIYQTLADGSQEDIAFAQSVYEEARPNYHSVSYNTIDDILEEHQ